MDYETQKRELFVDLFDSCLTRAETKITPQGAIRINSEKIDHKNFSDWFIRFTKEPEFQKYSSLLFSAPSPNMFFEDFRRGLTLHRAKAKFASVASMDIIKDFSYDNFIPFVSIDDYNKKLFFNKVNRMICELDYKTYEMTVDKDSRKPLIKAVIDFNPYRPEQIYKDMSKYGIECTHINTFKKPEWQHARELSSEEITEFCNLPTIIDSFMSHLFPDSHCRNFVYDWLHYALTKRCETYLVLNGAKGIGKGIFTDYICKALIGKDNHKLAPPSGLDSNFNAILENTRMIIFDEFRIDEEDKINKLKRYINKDQMIEHKGQDVAKTIETYNSFVISSNSLADIKIAWDDRRFSVMDISETKLDEVWTKEKIQELIDAVNCEDSDVMRDFGYWLLYRKPEGNEFTVYKGKHFYKLCYSSLPEWSRTIIDDITTGMYDVMDDISIKISYKDRNPMGRFPHTHKVEDFLKNYKHDGKDYLGELVRDGKNWHIQVSEAFKKKSAKDNTNIEWDNIL
jgi:hypothetical protein